MLNEKLTALVIIVTLVLNLGTVSYAGEIKYYAVNENVHQKAVKLLEKGYGEYYNYKGSKATLCCKHEENGIVEESFFLEIDVILKASSVYELDYFRGIMDYKDYRLTVIKDASMDAVKKDLDINVNSLNNVEYFSLLLAEVTNTYDNFSQYIGQVQNLYFYVKATYEKGNYDTITILYENGMDYVPAEKVFPPSHEELQQNGYDRLEYVDSNLMKTIANGEDLSRTARLSYSLLYAIGYTGQYSSNPTSCSVCGPGCDALVNTSEYNTSYPYYIYMHNGQMRHVDCANFISQALHAGGIPTSSTWQAGTSNWTSVSDLTTYMLNQGYWDSIPISEAWVGDILTYKEGSHVVMITAHDGVQYRYSGHTNDRENVTINLSDNDHNCYTVTY